MQEPSSCLLYCMVLSHWLLLHPLEFLVSCKCFLSLLPALQRQAGLTLFQFSSLILYLPPAVKPPCTLMYESPTHCTILKRPRHSGPCLLCWPSLVKMLVALAVVDGMNVGSWRWCAVCTGSQWTFDLMFPRKCPSPHFMMGWYGSQDPLASWCILPALAPRAFPLARVPMGGVRQNGLERVVWWSALLWNQW